VITGILSLVAFVITIALVRRPLDLAAAPAPESSPTSI